jgi:hydroxyacylglutathione hydrolase
MSLRIHSLPLGMARAYLIEYEAGLVLVDAGSPGHERRVLGRLRALGRSDLKVIYITHAHLDHYGCAAALRAETGASIVIHRADAQAMARGETPLGSPRGRGRLLPPLLPLIERNGGPEPTPADRVLDDGDDLDVHGLDARMVHTPGHTPGSSCLLVEGRHAFVGDLLSNVFYTHVQRLYATDWSLIPSSLARVQALRPEWAYAGHGRRPLSGRALQRLRAGSVSAVHPPDR